MSLSPSSLIPILNTHVIAGVMDEPTTYVSDPAQQRYSRTLVHESVPSMSNNPLALAGTDVRTISHVSRIGR
jgi:hypothetical protein